MEMDAAALDHLKSELAALAFSFEQEKTHWQQAFKAQETELRALSVRQEALQWRQDELEASVIELRGMARAEFTELATLLDLLRTDLSRLEAGHEQELEATSQLRDRVDGLSSVMDDVFDDVAERITNHEQGLERFREALSEQQAMLGERLDLEHDRITEGLAEAQEAADGHADAMIELKDQVATSMAETRDQREAVDKLVTELEARVETQQEAIRQHVADLEARLVERMELEAASRLDLERTQQEAVVAQAGINRAADEAVLQLRHGLQLEMEGLGNVLNQLAGQGQMLAEALESVQQGSIKAELQLNTALRDQAEAMRLSHEATQQRLEQAIGSLHAALSKTHQHLKELESKIVKALSLQRNENQEHEHEIQALRDDFQALNNRVGTIVQLLTKASRPTGSSERAMG